MSISNKNVFLLLVVFLGGCSVASTIQKASTSKSHFEDAVYEGEKNIINDETSDKDAFRIFHQASTGFTSIQSIRFSAEKRASDFCKKEGKEMHTLRERTSSPPHIFGNFPRIEIVFACKFISSSPLKPDHIGKYEQLKQLKSLFDDGALTKKEYNLEKTKVLSN